MKREIPDFTVFQGYEHTILPALAIGAAGGFAILMNALPKEYVKLYDLVKRNKWEEAAALCSECQHSAERHCRLGEFLRTYDLEAPSECEPAVGLPVCSHFSGASGHQSDDGSILLSEQLFRSIFRKGRPADGGRSHGPHYGNLSPDTAGTGCAGTGASGFAVPQPGSGLSRTVT